MSGVWSSPPVMKTRAKRAPRVAVLLSGCGVYDGSEAQEVVAILLALDRAGAEALCVAPNVPMPVVINHLSGHPMIGESRNVLVESARLARGDVRELARFVDADCDAVVVPGGYGATRVLCDHASAGRGASVLPDVARFLDASRRARRPMGFACMSPVVAARVFGSLGVSLGTGAGSCALDDMAHWGAKVAALDAKELSVDREHRIVCCAAFTATERLSAVYEGIERMVRATLELAV